MVEVVLFFELFVGHQFYILSSVDTEADNNGIEMDDMKLSSREKSMEPEEDVEEAEPEREPESKPQNVVVAEPKSAIDRKIEAMEANLPPIDRGALRRWRKQVALEVCNWI